MAGSAPCVASVNARERRSGAAVYLLPLWTQIGSRAVCASLVGISFLKVGYTMKTVQYTITDESGHVKTLSFDCLSFACSQVGVAFTIEGCKYAAFLSWDELPSSVIGFVI